MGDGEISGNNPHLLERVQHTVAERFDSQLDRAKEQDWWTFSKIWLVVSGLLIFISGFCFLLIALRSYVSGVDIGFALSAFSLLITLAYNTVIFYVIGFIILSSLVAAVSIATGKEEIIKISNQRYRYILHVGKIVAGLLTLYAIYDLVLSDLYSGIFEFIAVVFGITGLLILPIGLILWGVAGVFQERKFTRVRQS